MDLISSFFVVDKSLRTFNHTFCPRAAVFIPLTFFFLTIDENHDEYDGSVKSTLRLTFYFNTDSFQDATADSAAPCWVWDEL